MLQSTQPPAPTLLYHRLINAFLVYGEINISARLSNTTYHMIIRQFIKLVWNLLALVTTMLLARTCSVLCMRFIESRIAKIFLSTIGTQLESYQLLVSAIRLRIVQSHSKHSKLAFMNSINIHLHECATFEGDQINFFRPRKRDSKPNKTFK